MSENLIYEENGDKQLSGQEADNITLAGGASKVYQLMVNGRAKDTMQHKFTYEELVKFALDEYIEDEIVVYTVTYFSKQGGKEATLVKGQELTVKEGMIINVRRTDRS